MPAKRRVVTPPEPVEPVEFTAELTGVEVTMYRCPVCGRSSEDLTLIEQDIALHGGEK